jgi:hypothetical protein
MAKRDNGGDAELLKFLAREFEATDTLEGELNRSTIVDFITDNCPSFQSINEEQRHQVLQNAVDTVFPGLLRSHQKGKKRPTVRLSLRLKPKPIDSLLTLTEKVICRDKQTFEAFLFSNPRFHNDLPDELWNTIVERAIYKKLVSLGELQRWGVLIGGGLNLGTTITILCVRGGRERTALHRRYNSINAYNKC